MEIYDILIVGGGPAGLFASFTAGSHAMATKIIDILPELGGQLTSLYPEKFIYDIPGFPKILARDFASYLIDQAMQFNPEIRLGEKIVRMEHIQTDEGKLIKFTTDNGEVHFGRTILMTTGLSEMFPKKLDLPDIARFEDKGILYYVKNLKDLAGKRVLIVGGGNSALDWALNLNGIASEITIIHRRDTFRGQERSVEKLQNTPTFIKLSHELKAIRGSKKIESATIFNNRSGIEETLSLDHILFCLGFYTLPGPLKEWGLELKKNDIIVNSNMETNLPGIYAAGDICFYPGKVKMIVTGLGEAAMAVNAIREKIKIEK
jgi:ferredoxin/flavodoxin---NADP+ reductase